MDKRSINDKRIDSSPMVQNGISVHKLLIVGELYWLISMKEKSSSIELEKISPIKTGS